jgi:hypothetical protein
MVELLIDWFGAVNAKRIDPVSEGLWLEFDRCDVLLRQIKPETFSIFELSLTANNGRLRIDGWNDRWWWEGIERDSLTAGYDCLGEPQFHRDTGVERFMVHVYADLVQGISNKPGKLRRLDRALAVHDVLEGWV